MRNDYKIDHDIDIFVRGLGWISVPFGITLPDSFPVSDLSFVKAFPWCLAVYDLTYSNIHTLDCAPPLASIGYVPSVDFSPPKPPLGTARLAAQFLQNYIDTRAVLMSAIHRRARRTRRQPPHPRR